MKFAKGLEDNMVPEWRSKYIDYKGGKKKIKAITRELRTNASPYIDGAGRKGTGLLFRSPQFAGPPPGQTPRPERDVRMSPSTRVMPEATYAAARNTPNPVPEASPLIHQAASSSSNAGARPEMPASYGSIIATPMAERPPSVVGGLSSLSLPEPMQKLSRSNTVTRSAPRPILKRRIIPNVGDGEVGRPLLQRVFSSFAKKTGGPPGGGELPLDEAAKQEAQTVFTEWLEGELHKIDEFYRQKEAESVNRLRQLKEQLHALRDQRAQELYKRRQAKLREEGSDGSRPKRPLGWTSPMKALKESFGSRQLGTPALNPIPSTPSPFMVANGNQPNRDYTLARPKPTNEVPYSTAKRKLKVAMIEFYRSLELLKTYCMQNREGFRKICKKFDKATGLRTSKRFMTDKVHRSYFGTSEVLDTLIAQTEDLFARYFERGNRKHAIERLRTKEKSTEFYGSTFRSGIYLGLAAFAAVNGLVRAVDLLGDDEDHEQTAYLLQLWAGFFLPIFFMHLFVLNCMAWAKNKINYVFIFEFDTRDNLDYRQLLEIPALLMLLMSICMWLNFEDFWEDSISATYYPVIFLAIAAFIIFNPFPILYHKSRLWFGHAHFRLFFSGFFPVEFRDFFLGDMFCSQTYMMGNIALFFCLYNDDWEEPAYCNSNYSRLMGFFTALPGIWRFLQCLRRYRDTKNVFPHLVNGGKYLATIMYYVTLSVWRISGGHAHAKAAFIIFATINGIYTTVWDLAMDWSLLNPYAKYPFLRDNLGFKNPLWYYLAMLIDPIIRFNWVFFLIFENSVQHSAFVSFAISLSEVLRRFMWTFFRMENEHCTNVSLYRASREVPLPYKIEHSPPPGRAAPFSPTLTHTSATGTTTAFEPTTAAAAAGRHDEEAQTRQRPSFARRRSFIPDSPAMRALGHVGAAINRAHTQDFERKRERVEDVRAAGEEEDEVAESEDEEDEDSEGALTTPPAGRD